jgi:hypothetical protein
LITGVTAAGDIRAADEFHELRIDERIGQLADIAVDVDGPDERAPLLAPLGMHVDDGTQVVGCAPCRRESAPG